MITNSAFSAGHSQQAKIKKNANKKLSMTPKPTQ